MSVFAYNYNLSSVKYKQKEIQGIYYKNHKIFPDENDTDIFGSKYFGPTCYWNISHDSEQIELIVLSIEGGYIKGLVNNGAWFFICQPVAEPTLENPCIGVSDNGDGNRKYDLFFSQSLKLWVWNDITLADDNVGKFRYLSLSEEGAKNNKSTNLAGLRR